MSSVYQYENDGEGVDDRCWVQLKWNTIQRVHRAYEADFRQFGYSATPGTAEAPTRGYTKPEYARRRAAALGAGRWTMRAQGEVDKDGVARCLKPLRRNFLNAMFQGGFIEPEFLNVLTEAQFSGRIWLSRSSGARSTTGEFVSVSVGRSAFNLCCSRSCCIKKSCESARTRGYLCRPP